MTNTRAALPWSVVSTVDDSHPHFAKIWIAGYRFHGDVIDYVIHYDE